MLAAVLKGAVETYIKIYKQAKYSIYIIDDYISSKPLELLKKKQKNVNTIIFSRNKSEDKVTQLEVNMFNKQYPTLSLKFTNKVHDRFIVIDYDTENESLYVCGASSKDSGQKICTIIQLRDKEKMHLIIDELLKSSDFKF